MFKGVIYALSACLIWGLIFIVPGTMAEFSPLEISLGRYCIYGAFSWLVILKWWRKTKYSLSTWTKAMGYSLIITCGYYTCLVLALRYATPAITALIIGASPIMIAFYGNWRQKEVSFKSLIIPSSLILIGLCFINIPQLQNEGSPVKLLWGVCCAFLSMAAWSWFVVANARFLKNNPNVDSGHWNDMIGATSLFNVFLLGTMASFLFDNPFQFDLLQTWDGVLVRYILGCSILGVMCSWVASALWNKASFLLPITLTGQLSIFETVFGILFFYLIEWKFPLTLECVGIALFLVATVIGINRFERRISRNPTPLP